MTKNNGMCDHMRTGPGSCRSLNTWVCYLYMVENILCDSSSIVNYALKFLSLRNCTTCRVLLRRAILHVGRGRFLVWHARGVNRQLPTYEVGRPLDGLSKFLLIKLNLELISPRVNIWALLTVLGAFFTSSSTQSVLGDSCVIGSPDRVNCDWATPVLKPFVLINLFRENCTELQLISVWAQRPLLLNLQ